MPGNKDIFEKSMWMDKWERAQSMAIFVFCVNVYQKLSSTESRNSTR